MKKVTPKNIWSVLKQSFKGFSEDKVPKMSASLAYYTVFSLAPLLIMLIFITSVFLGREAIEGSIYGQLRGFVGSQSAIQIQEIVKNASLSNKSTMAAIIGVIALIVGATTVFGEIQDSINTIWGLRAKPKAGLWKLVKDRLLSFGIIGSLGFLLLVSLAVTAIVEGLNARLQNVFPDVTVIIFYIINLVITLAVVSTLFAVIFKVLPDAKIKWKDVMAGSIATAVLFMLGKFLIALYVSKSDIGGTYGTAGSFVILLVWIYYSSFILYFGAEFTKSWAMKFGSEIHPNHFAVVVKKVEVESTSGSVQQNEAELQQHKEDIKNGITPQLVDTSNAPPQQPTPPPRSAPAAATDRPYKRDEQDEKTVRRATNKSVGMLTVVGGLLLYFVNSSANKSRDL